MYRNLILTALVAGFCLSLAVAQQPVFKPGTPVGGQIMRGDNNKFMVRYYNTDNKQFAPTGVPLPTVNSGLQVYQMQGNQWRPVPGGLQSDVFKNLNDKGAYATFRMQDNQASQIYLWPNEAAWQKGWQTFPTVPPIKGGTGGTSGTGGK